MNNDITQIGAIVIVVQAAFKFGEMIVNKYTGNGASGIRNQIDKLTQNHIHELKGITNRIDRRTEEINNHLIEIKQILRKWKMN